MCALFNPFSFELSANEAYTHAHTHTHTYIHTYIRAPVFKKERATESDDLTALHIAKDIGLFCGRYRALLRKT